MNEDPNTAKGPALGQGLQKGFQGSRNESIQGGSRVADGQFNEQSRGPIVQEGHYFEENFHAFETEDYRPTMQSFDGRFPGRISTHQPEMYGGLEQFDPMRGMYEGNHRNDHMRDQIQINRHNTKRASKPPIIREGDWLCPGPTVGISNKVS